MSLTEIFQSIKAALAGTGDAIWNYPIPWGVVLLTVLPGGGFLVTVGWIIKQVRRLVDRILRRRMTRDLPKVPPSSQARSRGGRIDLR